MARDLHLQATFAYAQDSKYQCCWGSPGGGAGGVANSDLCCGVTRGEGH